MLNNYKLNRFISLINGNLNRWLTESKFLVIMIALFLVPIIQMIISIIRMPELKENLLINLKDSKDLKLDISKLILKNVFDESTLLLLLIFISFLFSFLASRIKDDLGISRYEIIAGVDRKIIFISKIISIFLIGFLLESLYFFLILLNIFYPFWVSFNSSEIHNFLLSNFEFYLLKFFVSSLLFIFFIIPLNFFSTLVLNDSTENLLLFNSLIIFSQLIIPEYSVLNKLTVVLIFDLPGLLYYPLGFFFSLDLENAQLTHFFIGSIEILPIFPTIEFILIIFILMIFWMFSFVTFCSKDL